MSAHYIGSTGKLILQPDQEMSVGPEGAAEAKLSYKCPWSKLHRFLPRPLSKHPDFPNLLLYESRTTREAGDIGRIDCIYRGVFDDNAEALKQYECSTVTYTAPIESHPKFAFPIATPPVTAPQAREVERAIEKNQAPITSIVPLDSLAYLLYKKKIRGIISYYAVSSNFRVSYVSSDIPTGYDGVGKIATPENAPQINSTNNWLQTGLSWRKAGGVVYINLDYQGSGAMPWDADLYGE